MSKLTHFLYLFVTRYLVAKRFFFTSFLFSLHIELYLYHLVCFVKCLDIQRGKDFFFLLCLYYIIFHVIFFFFIFLMFHSTTTEPHLSFVCHPIAVKCVYVGNLVSFSNVCTLFTEKMFKLKI